MKYLPLYYRWAKLGHIENFVPGADPNGLCNTVVAFDGDPEFQIDNPLFQLMQPDREERVRLTGDNAYWASDVFLKDEYKTSKHLNDLFSSTRQNIVLFMAAMNGEL
jgi:hypothetical protein